MPVLAESQRFAVFVISEARLYRSRDYRLTAVMAAGTPAGTIYADTGNFIETTTLGAATAILMRAEPPATAATRKLVLARDAEVNDAYLVYRTGGGQILNQGQIDQVNAALLANSRIVVRQGVLPDSRVAGGSNFFDGLIGAIVGAAETAAASVVHGIDLVLAIILPGRRQR